MTAHAGHEAGKCPLNFDHYDHALQDDPYPTYARLRAEAPLFHNEEHDFWVMSRHGDLHKAWRTDDVYSNRMGVALDKSAWNENAHIVMSFLGMDPPEQTRLRKLVSRGFTPKRVAEMEPRIAEISLQHLEESLAKGEAEGGFDWIVDFAGKYPMDVISELLGVPQADRDEVRRLADRWSCARTGCVTSRRRAWLRRWRCSATSPTCWPCARKLLPTTWSRRSSLLPARGPRTTATG
jgi:cytochrome P450